MDVLTCSPNTIACASFPRTYISDLKGAFACHIIPWSFESVFFNSCQPQALKSHDSYPRPMCDDLPKMWMLFPDPFIFHKKIHTLFLDHIFPCQISMKHLQHCQIQNIENIEKYFWNSLQDSHLGATAVVNSPCVFFFLFLCYVSLTSTQGHSFPHLHPNFPSSSTQRERQTHTLQL